MKTDAKIVTYAQLPNLRMNLTAQGKSIVLTMGSYDLIHLGHLTHLDFCAQYGDVLVVGLGSDKTISGLKGTGRPINNQHARAKLLASFEIVNYVVVSEEEGPFDLRELATLLHPDFFVIPENDSQLRQRKIFLESLGSNVIVCKRTPPAEFPEGISTSKIVEYFN